MTISAPLTGGFLSLNIEVIQSGARYVESEVLTWSNSEVMSKAPSNSGGAYQSLAACKAQRNSMET